MPTVIDGEAAQTIDMLQGDIRGEHSAVIQYLQHAYRLGEGELACEIEAIAREEMRHFKWLCELVVMLGGDPTIERGLVAVNGAPPADLMFVDVHAELGAIARYEREIQQIRDPRVTRVLERIASDERAHLADFQKFVEELGGASQAAQDFVAQKSIAEGAFSTADNMRVEKLDSEVTSPATPDDALAVELLNEDTRAQYAAILQYLHLAFVTPSCEVHKELIENSAIDEMKHMGWFSEKVAGLQGEPETDHDEVVLALDTAQVLKASIDDEVAAQQRYGQHIESVASPDIKDLFTRVRFQEQYHEEAFRALLDDASKPDTGEPQRPASSVTISPVRRLTVGSLIDRGDAR